MAPTTGRAQLARRLRQLREREWPGVQLTQAQLAAALGAQSRVAPATLSSWESLTNPKMPTPARLHAYARFFATTRSLEGEPHLLALAELDGSERDRFHELEEELLSLLDEDESTEASRRALLSFDDGVPIVIICPEAPREYWGPLAKEDDLNFTQLHRYADLDALIELIGHVRALNPEAHVVHRLPRTVEREQLQNHLLVLGGVGWNRTTRRILSELRELPIEKLPIEQFGDDRLPAGEVFRVTTEDAPDGQTYFPITENIDGATELIEDVALLARVPNPFKADRTLTICNGVYSRGVLGAVLTVTDETVRPANEEYIARRFPTGNFAMLLRVPVVSGKVLAPDLQNPETRLFEWSPEAAVAE